MTTQLDQDAFVAAIAAATEKAGYTVERRAGLALTITMHGESMRCDLKTLYSAYQLSPHRLADIVDAHLAALQQVPAPWGNTAPPTEQEALESVLPLLNPAAFLAAVGQQQGPLPLHRPFAAGLIVTYVFDMPHHRAYLKAEMLHNMAAAPGAPLDAIHALALDNLRKRTGRRDAQAFGRGDQTILACETRDGYAATRVLLPDLMASWAERVPGRMVIGIPNRDFLIAFSDRNPQHVAAMARQVRRDAKRSEHPLTPELLVWQAGRITELNIKH